MDPRLDPSPNDWFWDEWFGDGSELLRLYFLGNSSEPRIGKGMVLIWKFLE